MELAPDYVRVYQITHANGAPLTRANHTTGSDLIELEVTPMLLSWVIEISPQILFFQQTRHSTGGWLGSKFR